MVSWVLPGAPTSCAAVTGLGCVDMRAGVEIGICLLQGGAERHEHPWVTRPVALRAESRASGSFRLRQGRALLTWNH